MSEKRTDWIKDAGWLSALIRAAKTDEREFDALLRRLLVAHSEAVSTQAADRARAEVQAAVLKLVEHWEMISRLDAFPPHFRSVMLCRAADLRAALNDTAALDRMLAEARAEALRGAAGAMRVAAASDRSHSHWRAHAWSHWLEIRAEGEGATVGE